MAVATLMPLVSIVTVNCNGKQFLSGCLESLLNLNYPKDRLEIFMIDNQSSDDSVDYVKNNFPAVKIIINDENNYAKANNLGAKAAKGEYVAFINNDAKADKDWLIALIKIAEAEDNIAGVGSKIIFPDGKINSSGHMELPNYYWADRGFKEQDLGQYNKTEEVGSITGAACLYRSEYLEKIGFFDEDFVMFLEDVDIAFRLRQEGWKIFYCPQSIAFHTFHGTTKEVLVSFYEERNRLLLIAKHFPDKLESELLGHGYFMEINKLDKRKDIYKILPEIFAKLLKHHDKETINRILPGFFDRLNQIFNLEKYKLIQMLDYEKNNLLIKNQDLAQKDNLLRQKDTQLQEASGQLRQNLNEIELKDKDLAQKDNLLRQKDTQLQYADRQLQQNLNELDLKDQALAQKDIQLKEAKGQLQQKINELYFSFKEANSFKKQISDFYSSETFKYIISPLWATLDIFKKIKMVLSFRQNSRKIIKKDKERVLFIKPQQVSVDTAKEALKAFKQQHPETLVYLFANLLNEDYTKLSEDKLIDKKIFFCPDFKKFGILEQIKTSYQLRKEKFDKAIVLSGLPFYPGYRRARILAFLSGARNIEQQFVPVDNANKRVNEKKAIKKIAISRDILKHILLFPVNILFLLGIVIIFLIFIVTPIKIRKMFYNFTK